MMHARALAKALGGDVVSPVAVLAPGPGHTTDDRSLSIKLDPTARDGFIVHSFAGDDAIECREHVRAAIGGAVVSFAPPPPPQALTNPNAWCLTWDRGYDPRGTLVETYLQGRRLEVPHADIRFHPRLYARHLDDRLPGMLSLYRNVLTNQSQGVHRTFLNADGTRDRKMMLGSSWCAAVKFGDNDPGDTLAIAEGIETALSVRALGWPHPVWACLSAGNIQRFPVLPRVRNLVIWADNDPTGMEAAEACGDRWLAMGRHVEIRRPKDIGADWNDVLRGIAR